MAMTGQLGTAESRLGNMQLGAVSEEEPPPGGGGGSGGNTEKKILKIQVKGKL